MTAGYSGTPLARKLGIKASSRIHPIGAPGHYWDLLGELPPDAREARAGERELEIVHFFAITVSDAVAGFEAGRDLIAPNGMIWASWPKKASGVPSELDGNRVRALGLERGLVDVKVCAVDETWSGLKFVVPVADRQGSGWPVDP